MRNPFEGLFHSYRAEGESTASTPRQWLMEALGGGKTSSGVSVSAGSAEGIPVIYACGRILAETLAQLPFKMFERSASGKRPASDHPLYEVLHDLPNPEMTASEFHDTITVQKALWGNSFAEIVRDREGEVSQLWPLLSNRMEEWNRDTRGRLYYRYRLADGSPKTYVWDRAAANWRDRLPPLLHLKMNAMDGIHGRSPIRLMRESLGLTVAAEEYGARYFANNGIPPAFITYPSTLNPKTRESLVTQMQAQAGMGSAHKLRILEGGFDIKTVGLPPQDSQFLETRSFQLQDGARIYRVPLFLLQHMEKSTSWGTGIEQLGLAFLTYTMMPWLVGYQQAVYRDLIIPEQRRQFTALFVVNALVRGDIKTRYEAYVKARQNGIMDGDEIRELEDLNARGGDAAKLWKPVNMAAEGDEASGEDLPVVEDDSEAAAAAGRVM